MDPLAACAPIRTSKISLETQEPPIFNVGEKGLLYLKAGMLSSGINKVKLVFFMVSITSISGIEKAKNSNASGSVTARRMAKETLIVRPNAARSRVAS